MVMQSGWKLLRGILLTSTNHTVQITQEKHNSVGVQVQ